MTNQEGHDWNECVLFQEFKKQLMVLLRQQKKQGVAQLLV